MHRSYPRFRNVKCTVHWVPWTHVDSSSVVGVGEPGTGGAVSWCLLDFGARGISAFLIELVGEHVGFPGPVEAT